MALAAFHQLYRVTHVDSDGRLEKYLTYDRDDAAPGDRVIEARLVTLDELERLFDRQAHFDQKPDLVGLSTAFAGLITETYDSAAALSVMKAVARRGGLTALAGLSEE